MMTEDVIQVARKLIDGLSPDIGVVRVYAYGSRVRGDADLESDLDLLVELRQVSRAARQQILDRAWELSLEEGYVISGVIAFFDKEFIHTGILPKEYSRTLHRAFHERQQDDYMPFVEMDPDELKQLLNGVRDMVQGISAWIRENA